MTTARLSPPLLSILSTLVEEKLGLHFGADDAMIFEEKLLARAAEAGFDSALDYYYFIRYDAAGQAELVNLANSLVVGETYFFRELDVLRASIAHVVVPAVARWNKARIWSSACAGGEEPLSVAMLLAEAGLLDSCTLVATDISTAAIEKARSGIYRPRSLRVLQDSPANPTLQRLADRWLRADGSNIFADRTLVSRIDYRVVNLLDDASITSLGEFDLVLCRNVLIYFSDATTRKVVTSLAGRLRDRGKLAIGASESLLRFGTELVCEERAGAFLYGKRS